MACPYFYPSTRLDSGSWVVPPRLPLGDAYSGECRARGEVFLPAEAKLRQACNVGYGRNCCDRFPESSEADAIRFHVLEDSGELIRIQYVFERDCWPREHGVFEQSKARRDFAPRIANEILSRQAGVFVESYRKRSAQ